GSRVVWEHDTNGAGHAELRLAQEHDRDAAGRREDLERPRPRHCDGRSRRALRPDLVDLFPADTARRLRDLSGRTHMTRLKRVGRADLAVARRRSGRGFSYVDPDGNRIRDPELVERARTLGIPPAWADVRIAVHPRAHIQA